MRRVSLLAVLVLVGSLLPVGAAVVAAEDELSVTFVAVRQGDAAVYRGPCGEMGVIDVNQHREDEVLAVLDGYGSRNLKWINASHYHADHIGGIRGVAGAGGASVRYVYDRGGDAAAYDSQTYRDYHAWATSSAVERRPVAVGEMFTLCSGAQEVQFQVVSVGRDGTARGSVSVSNEDDHSVCLRVVYKDFRLATCGDASGTDETDRTDVESVVAPVFARVDAAKVNHHGSPNSSNQTYVSTLDPEAAVISVGANGFGHPDQTVIARWRGTGSTVYQTHRGGPAAEGGNDLVHGNVTITTTGRDSFRVDSSETANHWTYPIRDSGLPSASTAQSCPEGRVPDQGFSDTDGNPHEHAIDCIVWWGIAGGIGGDRYAPGRPVTREQMATFVANLIIEGGGELPEPSDQGFQDIENSRHKDNINRLAEAGVVRGTSGTTYSPGAAVSRAQMGSFLVAAYEHTTGGELAWSRSFFNDTWGNAHELNVDRAATAAFTAGASARTYAPGTAVRRDQMASFIARVLNLLVDEGHASPPS